MWVLFPTGERPRQPGLRHIGYVLAVAPPLALVAYTTTSPWPAGVPAPLGLRSFGPEEAAALSQAKPFDLHLHRQARLPLTPRWFPDLGQPGQGVVAIAPRRLRDEILDLVERLLARHRPAVDVLGP